MQHPEPMFGCLSQNAHWTFGRALAALLVHSEESMVCKQCCSHKQSIFKAEMNLHFPGWEGLIKPTVWAFPEVVVCLDCGLLECTIPETELQKLAEDSTA
jgi:hypothetical protein